MNEANIIGLRLFDPNRDDFKDVVYHWEVVGFELGSGARTVIDPKAVKVL